jgi:predicted O-methyltransferase YrrM
VLEHIPGFTNSEELEWLYNNAKRMNSVVEIGTWYGRSAAALAESGCSRVICVDHFLGSPDERETSHVDVQTVDVYSEAVKYLSPYSNIEIMKMDSIAASRKFTDYSIDMVFIDGDHRVERVLMDLVSWSRKCKRLLCGHDVGWQGVSEALAIYNLPYELGPGSIWFMELRS